MGEWVCLVDEKLIVRELESKEYVRTLVWKLCVLWSFCFLESVYIKVQFSMLLSLFWWVCFGSQ